MLFQIENGDIRRVKRVPNGKVSFVQENGNLKTVNVGNGKDFVHFSDGEIVEADGEMGVAEMFVDEHLPEESPEEPVVFGMRTGCFSSSSKEIARHIQEVYEQDQSSGLVITARAFKNSVRITAENYPDPEVWGGGSAFARYHVTRAPADTPVIIDLSVYPTFTGHLMRQCIWNQFCGHEKRVNLRFHVSCSQISDDSITITKHTLTLARIKKLAVEGRDEDLMMVVRKRWGI